MLESVTIEVPSRCNLQCVLCPLGNGTMHRPQQDMPEDVFVAVLNQLPKGIKRINLSNWGEPLMRRDLTRLCIIASAARPDAYLALSTNATLLNTKRGKALASEGLVDEIHFSIDGGAGNFQASRGIPLGPIVAAIKDHLQRLAEYGVPQRIIIKETISPRMTGVKEELEAWASMPGISEVRVQPVVTFGQGPRSTPCPQVFNNHLVILSNGTITACCADFEGTLNLGCVSSSGAISYDEKNITGNFDDVLSGAAMQRLQVACKDGNFPRPCISCTEYSHPEAATRFSGGGSQ